MSELVKSLRLQIERVHGYEFRVRFDEPGLPALLVDEPPPLGEDHGPSPAHLLAAAIGSCLSASLLFCLNRAKVVVHDLRSEVHVTLERNERKRLRVGRVAVHLRPVVADRAGLATCMETYEDFCTVTQSVREGLDVEVSVDVAESGAPTAARQVL